MKAQILHRPKQRTLGKPETRLLKRSILHTKELTKILHDLKERDDHLSLENQKLTRCKNALLHCLELFTEEDFKMKEYKLKSMPLSDWDAGEMERIFTFMRIIVAEKKFITDIQKTLNE